MLLLGCSRESDQIDSAQYCRTSLDLDVVDQEVRSALVALQQRASSATAENIGNLAFGYEMNGFPLAALGCYEYAEEIEPENPVWPYYQALLYAARGENSLAIQSVRQSLDLDASYAPGWLWLGYWYLELDDADTAITAFDRASGLGASYAATVGLGKAYLQKDEPLRTVELLDSFQLDREDSPISYLLRQAHLALGNETQAAEYTSSIPRGGYYHWNDPRSYKKQSFNYSISAKLNALRANLTTPLKKTVLDEVEYLLTQHPLHRGLLTTAIEANRLAGDNDRIYELLLSGLEVHPDYGLFHQLLAEQFIASNSPIQAKKHLLRTIELVEDAAWAHAQLGLIYLERSSYDDALREFSRAIEADASRPQPYYYAGMVNFHRGNLDRASELLQKAIDVDPEFLVAYLDLSKSLMLQEAYSRSLEILKRVEKLGGDLVEIEIIRAEILRRQAAK